jgi:hypothetical protein
MHFNGMCVLFWGNSSLLQQCSYDPPELVSGPDGPGPRQQPYPELNAWIRAQPRPWNQCSAPSRVPK